MFVTGATGMVGSWLVRHLLLQGASVVALVRDMPLQSKLSRNTDGGSVSVVNGALEDYGILERAIHTYKIDTVFHLGAQTIMGTAHQFPLPTFETNIRGTWNLLEACRRADRDVRVVLASSEAVYGNSGIELYTEDLTLFGLSPYGVSKVCSEFLGQMYSHMYGLKVGAARCSNLYGGGDRNWSRIVPGTIQSILRGEPPVIRGNGRAIRDYLYVEDAVQAYVTLAEALDRSQVAGEAFNFSSEQPVRVLEIVETILRLMNRPDLLPRILDQSTNDTSVRYLCSHKAREHLGWSAQVALETGLERTIAWYRNNSHDSVLNS